MNTALEDLSVQELKKIVDATATRLRRLEDSTAHTLTAKVSLNREIEACERIIRTTQQVLDQHKSQTPHKLKRKKMSEAAKIAKGLGEDIRRLKKTQY